MEINVLVDPRGGRVKVALVAFAEFFVGFLRQYRREARAAQESLEGLIALSTERGFTLWLALATIVRGWATAEQGRNEDGIAQIQEGLAATRATGAELNRPHFLCLLAEACMKTGRLDHGLNALTDALAAADEHENRDYEPEIHRLKGELLLRQNDSNATEARSCFEQAIEIARRQSAKSWELRANDEPRVPVSEAGLPRRGARYARENLRLVHRGLRHRRSEGRQGAAQRVGCVT